jgi:ribosome biogenesis protein ERB1
VKQKLDIDPESLIPKLPDPKDLKPFPTKLSITYKGHIGRVRCFTVDPLGQWIASGSDDCTVRIWEVSSGRNMKTFKMESPVMSIGWNPNKTLSMLAVSTGNTVILLNPSVANELQQDTTKEIISDSINVIASDALNVWEKPTSKESEMGHYLKLKLQKVLI